MKRFLIGWLIYSSIAAVTYIVAQHILGHDPDMTTAVTFWVGGNFAGIIEAVRI